MSIQNTVRFLLIATVSFLSAAHAQDSNRPSPFGAARRAAATPPAAAAVDESQPSDSSAMTPTRDPFPDEIAAIQQADLEWRAAKTKLEDLGSACAPNGAQVIDRAKATKLRSVASYAAYYQKTVDYWAKIRDASGEAQISGRAEAAELRAHKDQLDRELSMVLRRKADLERSMQENHVDQNRKALDDLTAIAERKHDEVEKAAAALVQNETAKGYILKRRDYASERMSESSELLQGLRTETYLYQQLYNAILYRHNLACDRDVPRPQGFQSDWRDDVKKLGTTTPDSN